MMTIIELIGEFFVIMLADMAAVWLHGIFASRIKPKKKKKRAKKKAVRVFAPVVHIGRKDQA